jgi:hypothetical protein
MKFPRPADGGDSLPLSDEKALCAERDTPKRMSKNASDRFFIVWPLEHDYYGVQAFSAMGLIFNRPPIKSFRRSFRIFLGLADFTR